MVFIAKRRRHSYRFNIQENYIFAISGWYQNDLVTISAKQIIEKYALILPIVSYFTLLNSMQNLIDFLVKCP